MEKTFAATWQRGVTAKKYLQPPCSESLVTLWPDAKIVIGTVYGVGDEQPLSCGLRFFRGDIPTGLPREETVQSAREDGIPVHSIQRRTERCFFGVEAFCDIQRRPDVYIKVTLDNQSGMNAEEHLTLMLKQGKENLLTGSDDDGYCPYISDSAPWFALPCEAGYENGVLALDNGECRLSVNGESFYGNGSGMLRLDFSVPAKEKREIFLAFGPTAPASFDYYAEREKAENFWRSELAAIKHLPASDDPEIGVICRNFTAQFLQLFACPRGHDYVLPRQGSMQRLIWPSEDMPVVEAMSKMGDFSKYLRPVMDTYFSLLQQPDGQIVNFGIPWASVTGCCLFAFACYTRNNDDREYFEKYRQNALRGLRWIEKTRHSTDGDPRYFGGLFPPMRSCDYEQPGAQCWTQTDSLNLTGCYELEKAFRHFGGEGVEETAAVVAGYRQAYIDIIKPYCEGRTQPFTFPVDPHDDPVREKEYENGVAPHREMGTPMILSLGVVDESGNIPALLEEGCRAVHGFERGLTWRLADRGVYRDGRMMWYGSYTDFEWFKYYMRSGQREKAKQVLDAQLLYIMTPEYYMMERYDETNPYYVPWLPNGSANGRTILMMFDYYGG